MHSVSLRASTTRAPGIHEVSAPPNNAIQRMAGARHLVVNHLAVGGAPAAADGQRSAELEAGSKVRLA
jgi:hypothetical protein